MKKVSITIVWLISLGLITFSLFRTEQWLINGPLVLGWLFFAIQLTITHVERVYLFIKRIWFVIINHDCIWNMEITYKGPFERSALLKIEEYLRTTGSKIKIQGLSNTRKIYTVDTIVFETYVNEDDGEIRFSIHDLEISYRRSNKLIDNELSILFEKLQTILKPDAGSYGISIDFKGYNPYFGFYVRRLNAHEVNGFNVTFNVENDRVSINKNSIEINTDSLQHLRTLSKEYLALTPAK